MDKSFKQIDNSKFEYVYISLVDLNGKYYMFGDTQLKWMLQDLGYPLFGVFNPEPNYDVFDTADSMMLKNVLWHLGGDSKEL